MTINEAAALTGFSVDTLRYYERTGVVPRVPRLPSGRRCYDAEALARINLVRRLKAAGMPLKAIERYIALDALGEPAREDKAKLLRETRDELRKQLESLQASLRITCELLSGINESRCKNRAAA